MNAVIMNLNLSPEDIITLSNYVDSYFVNQLGLSVDSPTNIPGNRYYLE